MKHKVKIGVTNESPKGGIVTCRKKKMKRRSIQEASLNRFRQGNDHHPKGLGERCHHSRGDRGGRREECVKKENTAF